MSFAGRLKPVSLSADKRRALAAGYAGREVRTEVMMNLYQRDVPASARLALLPQAPLKPIHFPFMGNRPYRIQLISNGETFALASQQSGSRKPDIARLEVVQYSNLDFMPVKDPPSQSQIKRLHADWVAYVVHGFDALAISDEEREFWLGFSCPMGIGKGRLKSLAEDFRHNDAYEVLSDYLG